MRLLKSIEIGDRTEIYKTMLLICKLQIYAIKIPICV